METTSFLTKRGDLTIRGLVYGQCSPGKHAVILSHGFLATQKTVKDYASALSEDGLLAVTFDFCGGGIGSSSDGKSEDMTIFTEKADLLAVIQTVQSDFQPSSVSLMGCSQGGFVSALAAKELGDSIHRLVLFYPALCIPDDARKGHMMFYRFDPRNVPDLLGRLPMKLGGAYARSVLEMDPFHEIAGYPGPVLLVHGTEDKIVSVSYARKALECYADCEYHEILGGGHGFTGKHDREATAYLRLFLTH